MRLSEIGDCGAAPDLLGGELAHGGEDGGHGHVHPNVDGPEFVFDPACCRLDGFCVSHISRYGECAAAMAADFSGG